MKKIFYTLLIFIVCSLVATTTYAEAPNSPTKLKKKKHISENLYQPEPDKICNKPHQQKLMAMAHEAINPLTRKSLKSRDGIDVSHYQGKIDWQKVASSENISYAYMKATEGASLVDDTYQRNISEARQVGIKVGAYHFYRPNISIDEQFQNMTSVVKASDQDLLPIIDVEHRGNVSEAQFISDLKTFLERITKFYGRKPIVYTFHNFYNNYLQGKFRDYKWMIARYREDEPTLNDGQDFVMWQYSSKGRIQGIKGNVDQSMIMENFSTSDILF